MKNEGKLSLLSAIFININIMIGAGLFINTTNLAQMAGAAGFVSYALLALLMYPLIASIAHLVRLFPSGGFYVYAKQLHPLLGFISAWSYFVGKLASAGVLLHASMLLLQQIIPLLAQVPTFSLDLCMLALFLFLNLFNLRTGSSIQRLFLTLKAVPVLFVISTGLYLFDPGNYHAAAFDWSGLLDTLPLVMYAAIGFEAVTSLSNKIQDAQKNGPRVILFSYMFVMCVNIAYQFFFYGSVGSDLGNAGSFLNAFPLLLTKLFGTAAAPYAAQALFNVAIACSALGATYGILFSNSWNLHTLAEHNLLIGSPLFLKKNRYDIPYWCIFTEIFMCLFYLIVTRGAQIPLQQIAVFSCTIAYSLSILTLVWLSYKKRDALLVPTLGLINCLILLGACIHSFVHRGFSSLLLFGGLMVCGLIAHAMRKSNESSM